MAALTEARYEALRCARAAARIVPAKHPCFTDGGYGCGEDRDDVVDLRPEGDRRRICHEGKDVVSGQDPAGAGGSK